MSSNAPRQHRPSVSTLSSTTLSINPLSNVPRLSAVTSPRSAKPPQKQAMPISNPPSMTRTKAGDEDLSRLEPDQMFAKFTVTEIRALKSRFRTEADSKQEELRLMVGERYRDLLEASSAIVSISEASKRVVETLGEMKDACDTSKEVHALQHNDTIKGHRKHQSVWGLPSLHGRAAPQDSQLVTLQSLAAHLKLLLDTPEQLWRLLERKRFLHAAWLYLLARVVYRALAHDEEEDRDVQWSREGIEVNEQFPLAERQWHAISSFRSQISYRASQSLREPPPVSPPVHPSSSNVREVPTSSRYLPTAETLLSIHLLDSLPLSETLSLFLSQRAKTMQVVFSAHESAKSGNDLEASTSISKSRRKNQELAASLLRSPNRAMTTLELNDNFRLPATPLNTYPGEQSQGAAKRKRNRALKHVRASLRKVVDIICETMEGVRVMYGGEGKTVEPSLLSILLEVSAAAPDGTEHRASVNTPLLLHTLPSSSLLVRYLPASIQSYAPYIDTASTASHLQSSSISSMSSEWFKTALEKLKGHLESWLEDLDGIAEIWSIQTAVTMRQERNLGTSVQELEALSAAVMHVCAGRVKTVWKDKLEEINESLVKNTALCMSAIREGGKQAEADIYPTNFYFAPDFIPAVTPFNAAGASPALSTCKQTLQQRVSGITPLISSVLSAVENLASSLKVDLQALEGPEGETRHLASTLILQYVPEAEACAFRMADSLRDTLRIDDDDIAAGMAPMHAKLAVFIGKIALALRTTSSTIPDLLVKDRDCTDLKMKLASLHEMSIELWRAQAVTAALKYCQGLLSQSSPLQPHLLPSYPSAELSQALMSLVRSMQELGLSLASSSSRNAAGLLDAFATALAERLSGNADVRPQTLWDLSFLSQMCSSLNGPKHTTISELISKVKSRLQLERPGNEIKQLESHIGPSVESHFARCRLLLGPLLHREQADISVPPMLNRNKSGFAGQHLPPAEKDFQLALEIAKPSSRFGLLLVGSGDTRL